MRMHFVKTRTHASPGRCENYVIYDVAIAHAQSLAAPTVHYSYCVELGLHCVAEKSRELLIAQHDADEACYEATEYIINTLCLKKRHCFGLL